jgi:DNA-binding NarL/FixJ family response regulator
MDPFILSEFLVAPEEQFEDEVSLDKLITVALDQGIDPKHVEILRAVAAGDNAATIAARYGVAERTARAWRAKAVSELRVRTRCAV